jgi:hypothetical protein
MFLLAALGLLISAASAQNVKVTVRAALYDRDLNVKPVPRLEIKLVPQAPGAQPLTVQTTLDGVAETELPPGKYKLITERPVELFDKSYRWELDVEFAKAANLVELSNDNAKTTSLSGSREARVDELAYQYKRVKDASVLVWTEHGAYDGFVVDPAGLVLTANRPVEQATWLAVQVNDQRRLPAVVVASDKQNDIAVLRINPAASGNLPFTQLSSDPGALLEGERVFTVENTHRDKDKKLMTGVVSKADADEIVSDVKSIYPGSPLFNSSGNVVGIGQYVEGKPHIRPIAVASGTLAQARQKLQDPPPSAQLLPSTPTDQFPFEGLRAPGRGHWEKEFYFLQVGDFYVELFTPVALYEAESERYDAQLSDYKKHSKGRNSPPPEPEYKYDPVFTIGVYPKTKTPFWENMAAGNRGPLIQRYKSGFDKLRLLCGDRELTPIWPGREVAGKGIHGRVVVADESSRGTYVYPHDAVTPKCGTVKLQVFSAKDPDHPLEKVLDPKVVARVWEDFEPYRKLQSQSAGAPK